jgi:hypothetical protein
LLTGGGRFADETNLPGQGLVSMLAAFVVKANAKKWTRADSLIARFNSLQGLKKFPVRMRRELARKALS